MSTSFIDKHVYQLVKNYHWRVNTYKKKRRNAQKYWCISMGLIETYTILTNRK